MGNVSSVEEKEFEEKVLKGKGPILVDFWAEWCGPCKALAPILEEVANEIGEKGSIVKVDIEKSPELAQKYGIRGIPTLIYFKDGEVKKTLVGNQPKNELVKSFEEV